MEPVSSSPDPLGSDSTVGASLQGGMPGGGRCRAPSQPVVPVPDGAAAAGPDQPVGAGQGGKALKWDCNRLPQLVFLLERCKGQKGFNSR